MNQLATEVSEPRQIRKSQTSLSADLILTVLGWLCLVVLVLLTVVPGLTGDKVFLGTNMLTGYAPWNSVLEPEPIVNRGIGDTIDSATPTAHLITSQTLDGIFPQWDPYNNGGGDLGALPNSAVFSPLSLPWWVLPASAAPAGVKLMEVIAVSLGMYLLLRRQWKLPSFTVPLASIIFVTSGFMVAWTNWPQTRVAAMIPLLFWATDRLATRHRWTDTIPMALVVASMLLGGFPAVTAYAMYSVVAYFVVRVIAIRTPIRIALMSFLRSTVGVILGIGLSAFQILPFIWFASHNVDFEIRSGRGSHLPLETLSTSIVPYLLGFPDWTMDSWPSHFVEGFSYIGASALVLILVSLLIRPRVAFPKAVMPFFAALLIVLMIAVYVGGPLLTAIQVLPTTASSPIGRTRSVIGFAAAVLAALGAAAVFDGQGLKQQIQTLRPPSFRTLGSTALRLAAVAAISLPILISIRESVSAEWPQFSFTWIWVALTIMTAVLVATTLVWLAPTRSTASLTVAIALVATTVPAVDVAQKWWPLSDIGTFYPATPTHSYLEDHLEQNRYVSVGQTLLPGTSSYYKLRALNGHGFTYPAWNELLTRVDEGFFLTPTYTALQPSYVQTSVHSPILDRLGVKYLVQSPEDPVDGVPDPVSQTVGTAELSSSSSLKTGEFNGTALGVRLTVLAQNGLPESPATVRVSAVSIQGKELTSRELTMSGIGSDFDILLELGDLSESDSWHLELDLSDSPATITFATDTYGAIIAAPIRSPNDELSVVHTGDSIILQRSNALDRLRWANSSVIEADAEQRLNLLASGELSAETVVLEHIGDQEPDSNSTATVEIKETDTDVIAATVTSNGPGWLVIADPLRGGGWTATVDGETAELLDADHAIVAIRVAEAGSHEVVIQYEAPLFRTGIIVSVLALGGLVLAGFFAMARHFQRREFATSRSSNPDRYSPTSSDNQSPRVRSKKNGSIDG
ncbi:MAG: hypothetical protein WAS54_03510 [Scrofimicrobium sp.]